MVRAADNVKKTDVVTFGKVKLFLSTGWTTKLANYKPITSLYINIPNTTNSKNGRISQTKIVRFQAPVGLNITKFRPDAKSIKQLLQRTLLNNDDTKVDIHSSTHLWQHIRVTDMSWEFKDKEALHILQFERIIPLGKSTYQVYQTFHKTSIFTAANMKEDVKIWKGLLDHITTK